MGIFKGGAQMGTGTAANVQKNIASAEGGMPKPPPMIGQAANQPSFSQRMGKALGEFQMPESEFPQHQGLAGQAMGVGEHMKEPQQIDWLGMLGRGQRRGY